jgi:hypothetical protein
MSSSRQRQLLFSKPKLAGPAAVVARSMVPGRTLRSPITGIGTEILGYREKIEVTRGGSPLQRPPVPMGRAHRRCTRAIRALPQRMPQTWDCLADEPVRCELVSVNLSTG